MQHIQIPSLISLGKINLKLGEPWITSNLDAVPGGPSNNLLQQPGGGGLDATGDAMEFVAFGRHQTPHNQLDPDADTNPWNHAMAVGL